MLVVVMVNIFKSSGAANLKPHLCVRGQKARNGFLMRGPRISQFSPPSPTVVSLDAVERSDLKNIGWGKESSISIIAGSTTTLPPSSESLSSAEVGDAAINRFSRVSGSFSRGINCCQREEIIIEPTERNDCCQPRRHLDLPVTMEPLLRHLDIWTFCRLDIWICLSL